MPVAATSDLELVFQGETLPGFDPPAVKAAVAAALKLDERRAQRLFSGRRVVLKRGVDATTAARYVARLAKLGARVKVEGLGPPPAPAPVAAPVIERPRRPPPREPEVVEEAVVHAPAREGALGIPAPGIFGFGFQGRLSRREYAMASATTLALGYALLLFVLGSPGLLRAAVALPVFIVLGAFWARLVVLRCHDVDRSGLWAWLLALPGLNLVAALALGALPGTHGENRFGEEPDEGNPWVALAVGATAALVIGVVRPEVDALTAPPPPAPTPADAAAPAAAAPAAARGLEPAAALAFDGEYANAKAHKAFAISTGGGHGWVAGAATAGEAVEAALAACDANRQPYAPPCEAYDADGQGPP